MDGAHNATAHVVNYHATRNGPENTFDDLGILGITPNNVNEAAEPSPSLHACRMESVQ